VLISTNNRVQAYARFLTHDEDVSRLDDLCAEMLGPFHAYVCSSIGNNLPYSTMLMRSLLQAFNAELRGRSLQAGRAQRVGSNGSGTFSLAMANLPPRAPATDELD
jgi:hypothetical protein